jgi:hypothetical protein
MGGLRVASSGFWVDGLGPRVGQHYIPTCYANRFELGRAGGLLHAAGSDDRAIKSAEAIIGIIGDKEALAA